jgi:hypothetical protein
MISSSLRNLIGGDESCAWYSRKMIQTVAKAIFVLAEGKEGSAQAYQRALDVGLESWCSEAAGRSSLLPVSFRRSSLRKRLIV